MNTLMSNTKFSLRKIKEITTDPKVLYTKANVCKKLGKTDEYIELQEIERGIDIYMQLLDGLVIEHFKE
jgi:hypothetical protein